jgi:cytosine/adenosine deaminase-related metal-dependent hydrolase
LPEHLPARHRLRAALRVDSRQDDRRQLPGRPGPRRLQRSRARRLRFIKRDDLGRLAPGAKADILLIDLDHLGAGMYADPIKVLVDAGGLDVHTVIVDGRVLVQDGRLTRVDEAEVYAKAREASGAAPPQGCAEESVHSEDGRRITC